MAAEPLRIRNDCDVLLLGGGLANSLIALALHEKRPDLRIMMLEKAAGEPSPQTWSVFRTDVSEGQWARLSTVFEAEWDAYTVEFPARARQLSTPYACLSSRRLRRKVEAVLGAGLLLGRTVVEVRGSVVECAGGETYRAPLVIDGRGGKPRGLDLAFQKFVGLELRLKRPHGLQRPIVMDATVAQTDGYRFLYVLPLDGSRLLVEDTRYSDVPVIDHADIESSALRYARGREWAIAEIVCRESGVLPVVLGGDPLTAWGDDGDQPALAGMRGLFFHPTTGYSLPDAMAVADLVAASADLSSAAVRRRLKARALQLWRGRGFYRALNRMLIRAAAPEQRYRVLERFYGLPQGLIERFYAAESTAFDKARLLLGKPPVPLRKAIMALPERAQMHV